MEKIQFIVCLILNIPMFIFGMYHLIGTIIMWFRMNERVNFGNGTKDRAILKTLMFDDGNRYCSAFLVPETAYKSYDEVKILLSRFKRELKYTIPVDGISFTPVVGIKHYDIFQSMLGKYINIVNSEPVSIRNTIGTTKFILDVFGIWFYLMFVRSVAIAFMAVPFSVGSIALVFAEFYRLSMVCFIVGLLLCMVSYMYISYIIDRKRESANGVLKSRGFIVVVGRRIMLRSLLIKKYFQMVREIQEENKDEQTTK